MRILLRWVRQIQLLYPCPAHPLGWPNVITLPPKKFWTRTASWRWPQIATPARPGMSSMQFVIALACRMLKLTPAQAIAASTINSAHAIRRADKIGSLEEGKQADLLVLSVPDYRHLGYRFGTNLVKQVIKRGRVYSVDVGYYRTA